MNPRNRISGFTLIELMIVLVLLSVATALVVPRLAGSLDRMNAESTARRIASALRFARSRAVTEKIPYLAVFDMDTNMLSVMAYPAPDETDPNEADPDNAEIGGPQEPRVYIFPDGIRLREGVPLDGETVTAGAFVMGFFPGGGTTGGKVILRDDKDRVFSVDLDRITGSVKIHEESETDL
ncbi:MAG: prepilin-type N-terminal cleavage/methylation domain-containing protein [Deltaproteobacteria bacterium]|nr:prepilin-type N-terminal cleavage/methylation domain-containing protein [Deltaproteobacteria bacterium]